MPTNAELHIAIDLLVRQQRSHILNNRIADLLDDMVDNIDAGGAATPTLDQVLAVGGIITAEQRTVFMNGGEIRFVDVSVDGENIFVISQAGGYVEMRGFNSASDNEATIGSYATATDSQFRIGTVFQAGFGPSIIGYIDATIAYIKSNGINEFADNAAALAAGLPIGAHYRTGDFQKIVH